jgi:hypothetical protein
MAHRKVNKLWTNAISDTQKDKEQMNGDIRSVHT